MRCLRLALILLFVACTCWPQAQAATVLVVLSEPRGAYTEFAEAFRLELKRDAAPGTELQFIDCDQLAVQGLPESQVIVGVGSRAAEMLSIREGKTPLLLSLLTRNNYERLPQPRRDERRQVGLFIDQPPARYLDLLRIALPQVKRIGVMSSRESHDTALRLSQLAGARRLQAQIEHIANDSDIVPAIQRLLQDGGVLLATPDASIYNAQTLPNIILGAYRLRAPVMGFSPVYVKSGAVLALYSTPSQLGTQSADIVRSVLSGANVPALQYPRFFSVGINMAAARSLGIEIESETLIHDKLERMERNAP